jgi:hypothetical protein
MNAKNQCGCSSCRLSILPVGVAPESQTTRYGLQNLQRLLRHEYSGDLCWRRSPGKMGDRGALIVLLAEAEWRGPAQADIDCIGVWIWDRGNPTQPTIGLVECYHEQTEPAHSRMLGGCAARCWRVRGLQLAQHSNSASVHHPGRYGFGFAELCCKKSQGCWRTSKQKVLKDFSNCLGQILHRIYARQTAYRCACCSNQ